MFLKLQQLVSTFAALFMASTLYASDLTGIQFAELPGERAEIRINFSAAPPEPKGYTIEQPARIVLDFEDVTNRLTQKKFPISVGSATSAIVVSGGNRTRLIVNLSSLSQYNTRMDGSDLIVEIGGAAVASTSGTDYARAPSGSPVISAAAQQNRFDRSVSAIENIDFRRGEAGEGKVIVTLSNPSVNIDVEEVASGVEVGFLQTDLPESLRRKLDVTDFATPVTLVGAGSVGKRAVLSITATGEYDYLAYQADNEYVISIKPLTKQELEEKKSKFAYVGEKLSLNFQDIEVRSVLQLIADFTELNLVASDTVSGNITLRLDNVPWDQALDLVLKTKGLDKRQVGNVLMVAPAAEIAQRERQELETKKQLEELAPLRTEYIRVRYANARELFDLFVGSSNGGGSGGGDRNSTGSILSDRGQAIVDERTNSIILTDTEEKISEFLKVLEQVDIPIRQVMIEARIVIANTDFRKEIGVRIAGDAVELSGSRKFEATGSLEGLVSGDGGGPEVVFIDSDGDGITDDERNIPDSTLVDLGIAGPVGSLAWNIISDTFLLGLELSALQNAGHAEIVSQPKVITGDKQQATIESGTEIPFQEASASGATTTSFKEAVLKLDVTPQITPDNRIIMDLKINQDSVGQIDTASGIPTIDVTQLETQVLVSDGETIVLGGIYQTDTVEGETKVPLLGDIPYLGRLFRQDVKSETKRELLIFVTPRVMASSLTN